MNKPHYYYKVERECETSSLLDAFIEKCCDVSEQARQWAEKYGASSYIESPVGMAGGVVAVEFENTLGKEGWEKVEYCDGSLLFVPIADSEIESEMFALPVVSETELINILKFAPRENSKGRVMPFTFGNETPVLFKHNERWYVDMPYKCLAPGITEISRQKFLRYSKNEENKSL